MIVDRSYYEDVYHGTETNDFEHLNDVAQSFIEYVTRSTPESLKQAPDSTLEVVKKAICAEIEYLVQLGGIKALNSKQELQKTSESYAGAYSYSINSKQQGEVKYANGIPYAPLVDIYLDKTGLLYTGVSYV